MKERRIYEKNLLYLYFTNGLVVVTTHSLKNVYKYILRHIKH